MTKSEIEQKVNQLVRLLSKAEGIYTPRKPSLKELRKAHYHEYLNKFN